MPDWKSRRPARLCYDQASVFQTQRLEHMGAPLSKHHYILVISSRLYHCGWLSDGLEQHTTYTDVLSQANVFLTLGLGHIGAPLGKHHYSSSSSSWLCQSGRISTGLWEQMTWAVVQRARHVSSRQWDQAIWCRVASLYIISAALNWLYQC